VADGVKYLYRCSICGNEIAEDDVLMKREGTDAPVVIQLAPLCANESHDSWWLMERVPVELE
jgi:hypothetical protein